VGEKAASVGLRPAPAVSWRVPRARARQSLLWRWTAPRFARRGRFGLYSLSSRLRYGIGEWDRRDACFRLLRVGSWSISGLVVSDEYAFEMWWDAKQDVVRFRSRSLSGVAPTGLPPGKTWVVRTPRIEIGSRPTTIPTGEME